MHKRLFFFLILLFLAGGVTHALAESPPPRYAIGVGLDYSSGNYGDAETSRYVTAPLIVDWFATERFDVELYLPLVYQQTTTTRHPLNSTSLQSVPAKRVTRMGSGGGGGMGSLFDGDGGLGDISLTFGYTLLQDNGITPLLRTTALVKFPTGDASKGLGSGEFDFGAGAAVAKWWGNWQPFSELRYILQGGAADSGARNYLTADAGVAYGWSDRLVTSVYARGGTRLYDDTEAPLEARLKLSWRFVERMYTDVYALKGLSDGSPDYGGGMALFMEF